MKRGSRQTVSPVPAPGGRILLFGTVFFTSVLSLTCQVIWLRKISFLFGATAAVVSGVIAVSLLGLAGGSLWGGRIAERTRRPWRTLGWLQIFLGAWVAVSLPILDFGLDLSLAVLPADPAPLPVTLVKLAVILLCTIAPALLIGGVFPLAVRLASPEPELSARPGSDLALIHGLVTLGGAAGALLAGFFFVPQCGLSASTWILGVGALDLGLFILLRKREKVAQGRKQRKGSRQAAGVSPVSETVVVPAAPEPAGTAGRRWTVLATFFLAGAAALLLETGWSRFFSLLNGTHIFSAATVLAAFLAGIGLGSLLMARFIDRIQNPFAIAAGLYAAVAVGGVAVFRAASVFSQAYFRISQWQDGYNPFQLTVCLLVVLIVLPAALALGAGFPLVLRLATRGRAAGQIAGHSAGRAKATGQALFANTLGAVLGALAAELAVLPAWGLSGLMVASLALFALAAVVFLALSRRIQDAADAPARPRWAPAAAVAVLLAGAVALSPAVLAFAPPFHALYYHGLKTGNWPAYRAVLRSMQVVEESHSLYGEVTVVRQGPNLLLKDDGKTEASMAVAENRARFMLGHLPLLFHPNPGRVLDLGLGAGATLRALVHHPELREITVVETDPRRVAMARKHFAAFNDHALDDPRVRMVTADGRNFVDGATAHYDVIISEPSNLWEPAASGRFTQELYRSVARHLSTNGIFCQGVPRYELKRNDFRTLIRTLHTVFPSVAFWGVGMEVIVLASPQPFEVELPQMKARLLDRGLAQDFRAVGYAYGDVLQIINSPAAQPDKVDAFLVGVDSLNLDDRPILEFNTARNLFDVAKGK